MRKLNKSEQYFALESETVYSVLTFSLFAPRQGSDSRAVRFFASCLALVETRIGRSVDTRVGFDCFGKLDL